MLFSSLMNSNMSRFSKQLIMILADSLLIAVALWFSFALRLGEFYWPDSSILLMQMPSIAFIFIVAPLLAIPVFIRFGLYKAVIRYIGLQTVSTSFYAVSLYSLLWASVVLLSGIEGLPRSVLLINWLVSFILISGIRIFAKSWLGGKSSFNKADRDRKNVVIYGAGAAGVQLASALAYNHEFKPVAFLDDSAEIQGHQVASLPVHSLDNLDVLINKHDVHNVLMAMPSVSHTVKNRIIQLLEPYPVHVFTMPDWTDIASGKAKVEDIKEIEIEDLLGRDSVVPNKELLEQCIRNKTVMVTGAGGSIGSELCRQIVPLLVDTLILFEQSEFALYSVEKELEEIIKENDLDLDLIPVLGDVNNTSRLSDIINLYNVQTIYHAAAYKHVPLVETNMLEGVRNNVFGTLSVAEAALQNNVERFVLISTDKAVRPTNVMGASKRFAELILQAKANEIPGNTTCFTMVRFGNVLGSSGSVVPLFRKQIKAGGPVKVTHPEIIRYFMTIPEAAQLVIQAGSMGMGGDVFVLDMGEPVKINNLAKKMIHLMGMRVKDDENPDGDIAIEYTGLRPGEKLYEELLIGDNVTGTHHALIMRAEEECFSWEKMSNALASLEKMIKTSDCKGLRGLLQDVVSGYKPLNDIEDTIWKLENSDRKRASVIDINKK